MAAKGGLGMVMDLDKVPLREASMEPQADMLTLSGLVHILNSMVWKIYIMITNNADSLSDET